uniref:ABC transporter substrate-binding protein n=1 Tax=Clostridium sp. TaxID=1506 RepID=UPI00260AFEB1
DVDNVTDSIDTIDSAYVNFSMEQIVEMNPDYILRLSHGDIEVTKKAFDEEFSTNPAWMTLDATKEGRVYDLDPVVFGVTANLSIIEAIEELGNIIYGE